MPSAEAILAGLTSLANRWQPLAIVWHILMAAVVVALLAGWRPSRRLLGYFLSAPVLSVAVLAWTSGNPFNGLAFALLALVLVRAAGALPSGPMRAGSPWAIGSGALLVGFGWVYPHFLVTDRWVSYTFASPFGVVPCPTLSVVIGLTLIGGLYRARLWSVPLLTAGLGYGVIGVFRLHVSLDYALIAGSLAVAFAMVSLRTAYERDVECALARSTADDLLTEVDLVALPPPVQRYLRVAGVVGLPRVHNFRVRMRGRIRNGPNARWIPFSAEQHNFIDEPERLFYLSGSMLMLPVRGYHRYAGSSARMTVRAAAVAPVVKASGEAMSRAETVTMFNDMCVMAPATLISPAITWEPDQGNTVGATFTNAGYTIRAELLFNDAGELVNFRSDDRYQTSSDGRSAKNVRWSTPLGAYRSFNGARLAGSGEGRWHEADGEYAYIEIVLDTVDYNLGPRAAAHVGAAASTSTRAVASGA